MSCCGKKRAEAAAPYRSWKRSPDVAFEPPKRNDEVAQLRYTGETPLSVRGLHSGRVYVIAGAGASTSVDPKDVPALLATRLFVADSL